LQAPGPIPYSQFIRRLVLCEVCIPFVPADREQPFMIFRWGSTSTVYGGRPNGPSYTLVHREDDEMVTVDEIKSCLGHLEPAASVGTISRPFSNRVATFS
jgi:hypothetical protein